MNEDSVCKGKHYISPLEFGMLMIIFIRVFCQILMNAWMPVRVLRMKCASTNLATSAARVSASD
jgi:hypothetical protein